MKGMTPRQAEALCAIRDLTVDGVAPSYAEIGAQLGGISRANVHALVSQLKKRGVVDFVPAGRRSLSVNGTQGLNRYSDAAILAEVARRGL